MAEDDKKRDTGKSAGKAKGESAAKAGQANKSKKSSKANKNSENPDAKDNLGKGLVTTDLNPQIVQAVEFTNAKLGSMYVIEANGIAYQKIAQALSYTVQDTADNLRNVMAMDAAVKGVCMTKMLETQSPAPWTELMAASQVAVTDAQGNISEIGKQIKTLLSDISAMT